VAQGQEKGKRKESSEDKIRQRLRAEEGTLVTDQFTYTVITLRKEHVEVSQPEKYVAVNGGVAGEFRLY